MKTGAIAIAAVCFVAFTGCVLKGPELRIGPPVEVKVERDGDRDHHRGGGKFCPPGLAKQGRC
jgi:hypothetical protein